MDINGISFQHLTEWILGTGLSGGGIILTLKFFGKKIFSQSVIEVLDEEYEKNIKDKVENLLNEKLTEAKIEMAKEFNVVLDNHATKCKSANLEMNDNRYLLRQEFKMYLDNQSNQNERVENLISELRSVCDQILLKLTR